MNLKKSLMFSLLSTSLICETRAQQTQTNNFENQSWQLSELWRGKYNEERGNFWFLIGGNPVVAPLLLDRDIYALHGKFGNLTSDESRGLNSYLIGDNLFLREEKNPVIEFKSLGTMKKNSTEAFFQTYVFGRADNSIGRFLFHYNILGNKRFVDGWNDLDMHIKSLDVLATTGAIIEPEGKVLEETEWIGENNMYSKSVTTTGSKLELIPGTNNVYKHPELPQTVIYTIEPISPDRFQQQIISRRLRKEFKRNEHSPNIERIK